MQSLDKIIEVLCNRFRCSFGNPVLADVRNAQQILLKLQHTEMFQHVLAKYGIETSMNNKHVAMKVFRDSRVPQSNSESIDSDTEPECYGEELGEESYVTNGSIDEKIDRNATANQNDIWQGRFKGYEILNESNITIVNQYKKCVLLTREDTDSDIIACLRGGVRCFMIDFFEGMEFEFQTMIVRLRESELKVTQEIGFPVTSTLIAKISPRLQYTGILQTENATVELKPMDKLMLTTNRYWSTRSNKNRIYVNARFLLGDLEECDFILIGDDIQVRVVSVEAPEHVHCVVVEGGTLKSRLPVLFPGRCHKTRLSLEEIEDITFAREIGVNIIISYIPGSKEYYANLQEVVQLLKSDGIRLWTRIVLNDLHGLDDSLDWIASSYDGFLIEFNSEPSLCEMCRDRTNSTPIDYSITHESNILRLCSSAENFLKKAYKLQKPIQVDITQMSRHQLLVGPENYNHIYLYPDKYVLRCQDICAALHFDYLQMALFKNLALAKLSKIVHCDDSFTGSNTLARSAVAAAYEANAAIIIVCGHTGRMAAKIAHYRPQMPILFVSSMQSAADFISAYHNVHMLHIYQEPNDIEEPYCFIRYKCLLLGLKYAKTRQLVHDGNHIVLVYGQKDKVKCPDCCMVYKYRAQFFMEHMKRIIFGS